MMASRVSRTCTDPTFYDMNVPLPRVGQPTTAKRDHDPVVSRLQGRALLYRRQKATGAPKGTPVCPRLAPRPHLTTRIGRRRPGRVSCRRSPRGAHHHLVQALDRHREDDRGDAKRFIGPRLIAGWSCSGPRVPAQRCRSGQPDRRAAFSAPKGEDETARRFSRRSPAAWRGSRHNLPARTSGRRPGGRGAPGGWREAGLRRTRPEAGQRSCRSARARPSSA